MVVWLLAVCVLLPSLHARDIAFSPTSPYQQPITPASDIGSHDDLHLSSAKFHGLTTYANLPYVHCLAPKAQDVESFDIAILGAPFDTVRRTQHEYTKQC